MRCFSCFIKIRLNITRTIKLIGFPRSRDKLSRFLLGHCSLESFLQSAVPGYVQLSVIKFRYRDTLTLTSFGQGLKLVMLNKICTMTAKTCAPDSLRFAGAQHASLLTAVCRDSPRNKKKSILVLR
jgi:hypothetical protein